MRPGRTCGESEPMRASPQHGSPAFRFSAPLRNRRQAGLLLRDEGDARRACGRSPASTRPGADRWPVRWWRPPSSSIPTAHSRRARRFQAAVGRRSARRCSCEILATALGVSVASVCADGIDAHRHPQGEPGSDAPGAAPACRCAPQLALADGRDVPPGLACAGRGAGQGRPALAVDRRRLDRRQGDARPDDAAAAADADSRYGFEAAYGLRDGAPSRRRSSMHGPVAAPAPACRSRRSRLRRRSAGRNSGAAATAGSAGCDLPAKQARLKPRHYADRARSVTKPRISSAWPSPPASEILKRSAPRLGVDLVGRARLRARLDRDVDGAGAHFVDGVALGLADLLLGQRGAAGDIFLGLLLGFGDQLSASRLAAATMSAASFSASLRLR